MGASGWYRGGRGLADSGWMAVVIGGMTIPDHVGACLKRALACAGAGDVAGALEAVAAAGVSDIQQHQQVNEHTRYQQGYGTLFIDAENVCVILVSPGFRKDRGCNGIDTPERQVHERNQVCGNGENCGFLQSLQPDDHE